MGLISLVGLPGAGKSVVGKLLARRLNVDYADTDHAIEQAIGISIPQIFERLGETGFRDIETETLNRLCHPSAPLGVLSTGGGAILRPVNRELLRSSTTVIYLFASPAELYRRLKHDKRRPLLLGGGMQKKLEALFESRDPLYREVADFVVETGRPSVQSLVGTILMQLELSGCIDSNRVPSIIDPQIADEESS